MAKWPDHVIDMCVGEKTEELLSAKAKEGYYVYGYNLDGIKEH